MQNPEFLSSVLGSLPGVDPNDESMWSFDINTGEMHKLKKCVWFFNYFHFYVGIRNVMGHLEKKPDNKDKDSDSK